MEICQSIHSWCLCTARETVGFDPDKDSSYLVVCWLGNSLDETNLWELIKREIRTVDWDNHAVNGAI